MDLEPLRIDRSQPQRRRRRGPSWLPRVLGGAGLVLVVGVIYLFWSPVWRSIDAVRLPKVRVYRVIKSHPAAVGAVTGMAANGYVVAARRAALSADTAGRIVEMRVTEGSVVKKGDLIARLYSEDFAAALRQAEADVVRAKATLGRAEASRTSARADVRQRESTASAAASAVKSDEAEEKLAKTEQDRVAKMLEGGVGTRREKDAADARYTRAAASLRRSKALLLAAQRAVLAAKSRVAVAGSEVKVAQALVKVAAAAQELAQATLKKTEVRAPFSGIVVLKDAEVGEMVSPGGSNARGSVVTMVDLDSLEVQADVPETSLKAVVVGGSAQIFLDAFPGEPYAGRVERIWPTANREKATVEVRIAFLKRDTRLRPEMGVRIVFLPEGGQGSDKQAAPTAKALPRILVPEDAVVRIEGSEGVFVLERDVASFRALQLGKRRAGKIEVLEGLEEGERIVVAPPPTLKSGQRTHPQEG